MSSTPAVDSSDRLNNRRLYLVGFMGSGKSTVGRLLAAETGCEFIELDAEIERRAGCSIRQIFAEQGEETFRELESSVLKIISRRPPPVVVSCGGGVVLREENRRILQETGKTFYLHVDPQIAWQRVSNDEKRPLAQDEQQFFRIWDARRQLYLKSGIKLATDRLSPEQIVDNILQLL